MTFITQLLNNLFIIYLLSNHSQLSFLIDPQYWEYQNKNWQEFTEKKIIQNPVNFLNIDI